MADRYQDSDDSTRLRMRVSHLEEDWESILDEWDDWGNIGSVKDELFQLIIQTHAVIEDLSTHLILVFVIKEEFQNGAFDYLYSGMSQGHREQLLVNCGILSKQTQGRLANFRGLRNEVAHGTHFHLDWWRDDVPERMNIAFEILDRMTDAFTDRELIDDIYAGEDAI
ncbi:uncharacterized protein HHUB_4272 (plasmid) [Halobacterium hubeiense]|uniref:DUF86 family protein n=1 Tax=Halobacterium hubeiense TaxID=1407499 RepID=A0A0U5H4X0_9EURY|nr:hypothetical protein [Halobacterium hubeiense]CQH64085.1 uncharacterized protein HHUB_4272 [Halobacterium hubeiense]